MADDDKLEELMEETENGEADQSQAATLVDLVLKSKAKLFHDQFNSGFISLEGNGRKVLKLSSKDFKNWLSHLGWQKLGKAIASATLETAIRTLEGHAIHEEEEIKLNVRIADSGENLYYDLGDGRAVEINKNGWRILDPSPILFYHFSHQQPQMTPVKGEDIKTIYNLIPAPKDPSQKLLLTVWLAAAIIPNLPHPVLVIHGPQGSFKTTLCKLLRRLIDPSVMEVITTSGDVREYVQLASHHYMLPLDNLSPIKSVLSDMLCRTVTGDAMSKRELYTDDNDVIYSFRRIVAMNGINLVVSKPDLLERSLIIEMERPSSYGKETTLFAKFDNARPLLLGALFDTVQESLKLSNQMDFPAGIDSFRMADFVRWGCIISKVLGYTAAEFMDALTSNLEQQNAEAIDDSPVAQVVIAFMQDKMEFQATPTDLLNTLKDKAIQMNLDVKQREFPKSPNWLWRRLRIISTNLMALGIKVERDKEGARLIRLSKISQNGVNGVFGVQDNKLDEKGQNLKQIDEIDYDESIIQDTIDSKDTISPNL